MLGIAFGLCFWQNHRLLHVLNKPLESPDPEAGRAGARPTGQAALAQQAALGIARDDQAALATLAAPSSRVRPRRGPRWPHRLTPAGGRGQAAPVPEGNKTVTLGIGEPFTVTLTISLVFALVLSLPVILFELGGFVLPALSPSERRAVLPLLAAIPCLFAAGVVFGYFVVLPAAVRFFQNFNSEEFNVLVQAGPYYKFAATLLLAMGLVFQVPVAILAATRAGIVTPRQLRRNRRYAILVCAVLAALLRGRRHAAAGDRAAVPALRGEYPAGFGARPIEGRPPAVGRRAFGRAGRAGRRTGGRGWAVGCTVATVRGRTGKAKRAGNDRSRRQRASGLMLFDLRGRGRRRLVQVIYIGLAGLIGLGLIGFGIGGGFGGGGLSPPRPTTKAPARRRTTAKSRSTKS